MKGFDEIKYLEAQKEEYEYLILCKKNNKRKIINTIQAIIISLPVTGLLVFLVFVDNIDIKVGIILSVLILYIVFVFSIAVVSYFDDEYIFDTIKNKIKKWANSKKKKSIPEMETELKIINSILKSKETKAEFKRLGKR